MPVGVRRDYVADRLANEFFMSELLTGANERRYLKHVQSSSCSRITIEAKDDVIVVSMTRKASQKIETAKKHAPGVRIANARRH
jgi:hypothetical protein